MYMSVQEESRFQTKTADLRNKYISCFYTKKNPSSLNTF